MAKLWVLEPVVGVLPLKDRDVNNSVYMFEVLEVERHERVGVFLWGKESHRLG